MTAVEAANIIREAQRTDPDLARAMSMMVKRAGCKDMFQWCNENPESSEALALQLADIDGQITNMSSRLQRGDLT